MQLAICLFADGSAVCASLYRGMVLSSVLTRTSRALLRSSGPFLRSGAPVTLKSVGNRSFRTTAIIYGGRRSHHVHSTSCGRRALDSTSSSRTQPVLLQVVYLPQRNFWSWKGGGAGQDGGNGDDGKAAEETRGSAGGGRKGDRNSF